MNYKRLSLFLILPQLAGIVGSLFTVSAIPSWYATLVKPPFSPPNWLFGPAWIILYLLMGVSIYLIWQQIGRTKDFWLFWVRDPDFILMKIRTGSRGILCCLLSHQPH